MKKEKNILKSGIVKVAFVTGICIIALAIVFKKILHMELRPLYEAIPAFIMAVFGFIPKEKHDLPWGRPVYWMAAIVLATLLIIFFHII